MIRPTFATLLFALPFGIALCVGIAHSGPAPDPTQKETARTDAAGDPLPPGVIARLGSTRLFHYMVDLLAFSPDNKILATADLRACILWDVKSGKELRRLELPAVAEGRIEIRSIAFSADSKLIAVGGAQRHGASVDQNMVRVWEIATGKERYAIGDLPSAPFKLAFDPLGRYLAWDGYGSRIQVWDLEKNRAIGPWGEEQSISDIAFADDGKTLVALVRDSNNKDEALRGYEVGSAKCLWQRKCNGESRRQLLAGGALVCERDPDGPAFRVLESATGKEVFHSEAAGSPRLCEVTGAGGSLLTVTGDKADRTVRIRESATGKGLFEFKAVLATPIRGAVSRDGKLVALVSWLGGAIQVWDANKARQLTTFTGHREGAVDVSFSPDGKTIYTTDGHRGRADVPDEWPGRSLRQWDAESGKELRVTRTDLSGGVGWTTFSPDGRLLAVVNHDGTLRMWDTAASKEIRTWKMPTWEQTINGVKRPIAVYNPQFSADGESVFVAATVEKVIRRWEVRSGKELPTLDTEAANLLVRYALLAPDGRTFVVWGQCETGNMELELLNAANGRLIRTLYRTRSQEPACAFSPNGKTLAVGDQSALVLVEVESGRERGRSQELFYTRSLAFSPDGKLLAAGGKEVVRLLHPASVREVGRVEGCYAFVESLAFSPDGKRLALAGQGNTALVCDVSALTAGKLPQATTKPTAKELDVVWADLNGADGAKAFRAIAYLADFPEESVPFLRERLKEFGDPEEKRIGKLIADLDDKSFEVRQKASATLESLGNRAAAALTQAVDKSESEEVRLRAQGLLEKLKDNNLPSKELIGIRVVEALETSDAPAARDLLKQLAKGDASAPITLEARAAMQRFDARKAP
jgi:WD40 repeat protein